jgi:ABC-2 type transport system permease protein
MSAVGPARAPGTFQRGRFRRTALVLLAGWKAEFSGAAEYRADLISGTLVSTAWLGLSVTPALMVSRYGGPAAGWTLPRLLFLQAVWYLLDGVIWVVLMSNCRRWPRAVRDGSLDAVLLRPVDSLALASLGNIYVQDVPKLVLAAALGGWAAGTGGGPASMVAALSTLIAIGCAGVVMWALGVLAFVKSLSQVQFDGMFAVHAVHNLARVPSSLYGPVLQLVFTVVLPVTFLATVPAELCYGGLPPIAVLGSMAVAAALTALARWAWSRELQNYTGAMG